MHSKNLKKLFDIFKKVWYTNKVVGKLIDFTTFQHFDKCAEWHIGMREWLSGGAPPCQGGGRGFDPRLALS